MVVTRDEFLRLKENLELRAQEALNWHEDFEIRATEEYTDENPYPHLAPFWNDDVFKHYYAYRYWHYQALNGLKELRGFCFEVMGKIKDIEDKAFKLANQYMMERHYG